MAQEYTATGVVIDSKGKGVVLISASQKEKKGIDEDGNTVTEKEAKKASRKKKK